MTGIYLVTGATSGIGREIARGLLRAGKSIGMIVRNSDRASDLVKTFSTEFSQPNITVFVADLARQDDVYRVAREILADPRPIAALINNAGVVMARYSETVDKIETTFAVNHVNQFLLTQLLLPKIKQNSQARVIAIASKAHTFVPGIQFDDIGYKNRYRPLKAYGQSKLANILFVKKLARLLNDEGLAITVNAVDPGAVATRIGCNNGLFARFVSALARPFFRPIPDGADTAVYLAVADDVKHVTGNVFKDRKIIDIAPHAKSEAEGDRLWQLSLALCQPSETRI